MAVVDPKIFQPPEPPAFEWDEFGVHQYFYFLPEELHDRLLKLTHNANLALAIGSAMWILARFSHYDTDREAYDFVNAVWSEMTSEWRCEWHYPDDDDWCGPIRAPMLIAMTILYDALAARGDNPVMADRAVWMHNLAEHVVQPLNPYLEWFEQAVLRLERWHSWQVEQSDKVDLFADRFPQGNAVSPEVLMVGQPYSPEDSAKMLARMVERERRNGNPFVLDPQEFDERDAHDH